MMHNNTTAQQQRGLLDSHHGKVYDSTDFAAEHLTGPEFNIHLKGQDGGAEAFEAVHSEGILVDFDPVGV